MYLLEQQLIDSCSQFSFGSQRLALVQYLNSAMLNTIKFSIGARIEFQGIDRFMRSLNKFVSILCSIPASFDDPGPVRPRVLIRCFMHLILIL